MNYESLTATVYNEVYSGNQSCKDVSETVSVSIIRILTLMMETDTISKGWLIAPTTDDEGRDSLRNVA